MIIVVIAAVVAKIAFKKYKEIKEIKRCDYYDYELWFWAIIISLTVGAFATAAFLYLAQQVAGWLLLPDAKVMEMVLNAIG